MAFTRLLKWWQPHVPSQQSRRRPRPFRPAVESLEAREVLSTFLVLNTNDSGAGSLRAAITRVNQDVGNPGMDEIDFRLSGTTAHTINLRTPLPALTHSVYVNGDSQPGFAGKPVIALNGSGILGGGDGFVIKPSGSANPFTVEIEALGLTGFGDGITLLASSRSAGTNVQLVNNAITAKSGGDGILVNAGTSSTTVLFAGNVINTVGGGDGITAYTGGNSTAYTFTNNTVTCKGGGDGIHILGGGASNTLNLVGNSLVVHNGGDALLVGVSNLSPTIVTVTNNVLNTSGLGIGLSLTGGSVFQAVVQGNNFSSNLIGVAVYGNGTTAGRVDLGGGALGSAGGNNFRSFAAATAESYAIGLFGVAPGYTLKAQMNLFSVPPTSAIADGSHTPDAGGSGSILV
jgi:hypothetical protein